MTLFSQAILISMLIAVFVRYHPQA